MLITLLKSAFPWRKSDLYSTKLDKLEPPKNKFRWRSFIFEAKKDHIWSFEVAPQSLDFLSKLWGALHILKK